MNRIYQLLWNARKSAWVVVSEKAKGCGVRVTSPVRADTPRAPSSRANLGRSWLTVLAILGAAVTPSAYATCTGLGTSTVACTSPPSDAGVQTSFTSESSTATLTSWQVADGSLSLINLSTSPAVTLAIDASNILINNPTLATAPALSVNAGNNSVAGGQASIAIRDSTIQGGPSGTNAVGLFTQSSSGSATITATNTSITAPSGANQSAVRAFDSGAGTARIEFTGGSIITAGSGGFGLFASSGTGAVTVISAANTISTAGAGVQATTGGAGTASITNSAKVTTTGASSSGLSASTSQGGLSIVNRGEVTTSGANSNGISAQSSGGVVLIDNAAAIATTGSSAFGIQATAFGGALTLTNTGTISTAASNTEAIRVVGANAGLTVSNAGAITTGIAGANGVTVLAIGTGNSTLTNTGNATINGGGRAFDVEAASGAATINQQAGDIRVTGLRACGQRNGDLRQRGRRKRSGRPRRGLLCW